MEAAFPGKSVVVAVILSLGQGTTVASLGQPAMVASSGQGMEVASLGLDTAAVAYPGPDTVAKASPGPNVVADSPGYSTTAAVAALSLGLGTWVSPPL